MSNAPLILALDISKTCTGIAEGRAGDVPRAYSLRGDKLDVVQAQAQLFDWLVDRTKVDKFDLIAFEAPLSGGAFMPEIDWEKREWHSRRDPHTTLVLAKMVGVVELVGHKRSLRMHEVNVKKARVEFLGHGNLKGPEAKKRAKAMCALLGWPARNMDESDAMCVWHYATCIAAKSLAHPILPSMHKQVATLVSGVDEEAPLFRRRA